MKYEKEGVLENKEEKAKMVLLTFGNEVVSFFKDKPCQIPLEVGQAYRYNTTQYESYQNLKPVWKEKKVVGYEIEKADGLKQEKPQMQDRNRAASIGGFSHDSTAIVVACISQYKNADEAADAVIRITKKMAEAY